MNLNFYNYINHSCFILFLILVAYEENDLHYLLGRKWILLFLLFIKETTSILLLDGSSIKSRIIYYTPNFQNLFNYLPKEILNSTIHDLMPNCVASFHKDLVNDALKF